MYQNSTSCRFLKVNCNEESKTILMRFFSSYKVTYDFRIFFGHLVNIGSLNYADLPNGDTFHCAVFLKFVDTILLIKLIRKVSGEPHCNRLLP